MSDSTNPTIDIFNLGSKGLQHNGLRRANERAVLTVIGFNPGLSNAEIARMSGLAPQTVSAILNDIEAAGLIKRGEVLRGRRGQPATPIHLRAEGGYSIGIEVGWLHADVIAINLTGCIVAQRHIDYCEADLGALSGDLAAIIAELTADWSNEQRARLTDIGISMPGSVDAATWPLASNPGSKDGPTSASFAAELQNRTGLPVTLFNDGNAACWAELIAQPSPRPESFVYLLVSTYLAAGLVGEGRLWQGPAGHSADLGAMLVWRDENGPASAHAVASASALVERITAAGIDVRLSDLENWDWAGLEHVVGPWIEDSAHALALVVFNTNAVVDAALVVLDSILPLAITERLTERLKSKVERLPVRRKISIVAGHVGRLAPALGAAELPLYQRYFSRSMVHKT